MKGNFHVRFLGGPRAGDSPGLPGGGVMRSPVRLLGVSGIVFGACLMGGLGFLYLLHPDALQERAGISPTSPSALAEIRSTYGGLHIGIALFLLACAVREGRQRAGLLFCGVAFAGAGVARVAGIVEFRAAEPDQVVTASLEIAFSVITLWLYRAWPAAQQATVAPVTSKKPSRST